MRSTRLVSGPGLAVATRPANSFDLPQVLTADSAICFLFLVFRRLLLASGPPPMHAVPLNDEFYVRPR